MAPTGGDGPKREDLPAPRLRQIALNVPEQRPTHPVVEKKPPCTKENIAAERRACDAIFNKERVTLAKLRDRANRIGDAVSAHKRGVRGYERDLSSYELDLGDLYGDLAAYKASIAGATVSTPAMRADYAALDDRASQLATDMGLLAAECARLTQEAADLRKQQSDYDNDLAALKARLQAFLHSLKCAACGKALALLNRANTLPTTWTIDDPSMQPDQVPQIPPPPPAPPTPPPPGGGTGLPGSSGTPGVPSPSPSPSATSAPVLALETAWPVQIPVDGAPRMCVTVLWWSYITDPAGLIFEPYSEPVPYQFGAPPTVTVDGPFDVTDIEVSSDGTKVFFTLRATAGTAPPGSMWITVTDPFLSNPAVIELWKASVEVTDAPADALAGLHASLSIAIDSAFDGARSSGNVVDTFADRFAPWCRAYEEIAAAMLSRVSDPPTSDEQDAWTDLLDITMAMANIPVVVVDPILGQALSSDAYDWYQYASSWWAYGTSYTYADRASGLCEVINYWTGQLSLPSAVVDGQPFSGSDEVPDVDFSARVVLATALGNIVFPSPV